MKKDGVLALALTGALVSDLRADLIPYPNKGTPNTATYSFTAAATGDVVAYFAGSTASYENQLGLLVNGVQQGGFGLDNHLSKLGQSYDFGSVNAGDTLVFVLHNLSLGMDAFSDPSMNTSYDFDGSVGHQHIYSTPYTATAPIISTIPLGTFVSFEDLRFPDSDFNYNDEDFVFTNVATNNVPPPSAAPEPSSLALLGTAAASFAGYFGWRRRKQPVIA
jgi:hypothetical protein